MTNKDELTTEGHIDFKPGEVIHTIPLDGSDIRVISRAIYRWANEVMPDRESADAIKKLSMEEVPELWRALKETGTVDPGEIADVLILALDICELSGIDPMKAIHNKMAINMDRKWKFEYGVAQHED